jgi:hypothetical protein
MAEYSPNVEPLPERGIMPSEDKYPPHEPETDPEVIIRLISGGALVHHKKRIAEMQSLQAQGDQAPKPDAPDPPFKDELTIIWREEKAALHARLGANRVCLDAHAVMIEAMMQRIKVLEEWALSLNKDKAEKPKQTPGAGIGHSFPNPLRGPKVSSVSPMEKDYEGPTEGPRGKTGPS